MIKANTNQTKYIKKVYLYAFEVMDQNAESQSGGFF